MPNTGTSENKEDIIGELGLLGVEIQKKVVLSHGESTVIKIKESDYIHVLKDNPNFLKYLSKNLATKLLLRTHHFTEMQQYYWNRNNDHVFLIIYGHL